MTFKCLVITTQALELLLQEWRSTSAKKTTPQESKILSLMTMGTCTLWPSTTTMRDNTESTDGLAPICKTTTSRKASGHWCKLSVREKGLCISSSIRRNSDILLTSALKDKAIIQGCPSLVLPHKLRVSVLANDRMLQNLLSMMFLPRNIHNMHQKNGT